VPKRRAILAPGSRATGAARKKAIVAVARQLAVDLWRWQTGQCSAEKLGLHGTTTHDQPMTGQPMTDQPMTE
jgi:hypothetical protein